MKLTRRKGFNFYRSYYDVFNKLPTDKDKLEFVTILLDKQFLDADPSECSMIVEFAYESQLHSITKQVKGWKDATSLEITEPSSTPQGVSATIPKGDKPKEVQEKEKEEEKEKGEYTLEDSFNLFWDYYHKITGKEKTDKVPAFKYWKKLTIEEQRKAYSSVKSYLSTVKDKQYLKKARTYLSDKNFNDEVANDNGLKYLNEQDKINRGLNPKREYIFSKVDGSDYAGLLTDKEKEASGLAVNRVYTIQNNLVV